MSFVRRIVAGITQFVAVLLVVFFTVLTGSYARSVAKTVRYISDQALILAAEMKRAGVASALISSENIDAIVQVSNFSDPTVWTIVGAAFGFLISTAVFGIIFMLAEIANNTRQTVAFFNRVDARSRNERV